MRHLRFAAIASAALLLAACGNNNQPAQPSSSAAASSKQVADTTTQPAAPAAPAADDKLKPLFGSWGLDPGNCGDQVLKISKTRFEGPGSGCDISGFTDNGNGTFTAAMSCTANGGTSTEKVQMRPIFAPTGEGIDLVYVDRNNLASTVLRCPAAQ